jgi:hypothetical protein
MSSDEDPYVVLNWNAESETGFAPAFGCELLWLWTKADKDQFPSCMIKGNVRLVLLTWNDKCEEDEYLITFRCGMVRVVEQHILQEATLTHNRLVKSFSKVMRAQRIKCLSEMRTPAYSVDGGYRDLGNSRRKSNAVVAPATVPPADGVGPPAGGVGPTGDGVAPRTATVSPATVPPADGVVPPADGVGPTADGVAPRTATVPPADGVGAPTEGRSNLSNPPPPPREDVEGRSGLRNPTPPPPEAGSSSGLVDLTVEELKEALKKANAKAKAEKKRLQEETDVTRKRIREAREELRTAMEEGRKKAKSTVKAGEAINAEFDDGDDSGDGFCDDDSDVKPIRKRLTAVEKWANGNKAMRERKDMYIKSVTVNTVQEVYAKLCTGGIAIMNNMKTLFGPNHQPDREQRDYIRHAPESEKQIVFEGVVLDDLSSSVIPHYHKDHVDARRIPIRKHI